MVGIVDQGDDSKVSGIRFQVPGPKIKDILTTLDIDPIATEDQLKLWHWVSDYYMCPIGDVLAAALPSKALDRQYELNSSKKRRVKLPDYSGETEQSHALDIQQTKALAELYEAWQTKQTCLLHGVTSSGKTEVYIHLIEEQLKQGRQVLYLVPEIALTTQLTDRLQRVFGNQLMVYHSRITDAQRMETYRQLLLTDPSEKPRVIIGARSAVFLPIRNLGLIILDEEHETSYKQQDPAPRYHARSVALMIGRLYQQKTPIRILLGTATPSIETYRLATEGKYGLATMSERYQGLQLPKITMIDLQQQYHRKEMYGHFSDPLVARIREELQKNKQIILFQNRRGYAPYMECTVCGKSPQCPDCDVSLTVHMRTRLLTCHYCGHTESYTTKCPYCGGEMKMHGFGTEKLEEEVQTLFPTARTLRMDLDTTRKKDDYQDIINAFGRHECDILIGTQMVSKGLHFNDVSLVAVLNADNLLNTPDFRSYERAFDMLEQVSGRAGRTGSQGEVVIQTFDPKNPIFTYLSRHAYESMYRTQLAEREQFNYPPYCRMIVLTLRHTRVDRLEAGTAMLQARLREAFGPRCSAILEPSVSRVQTWYLRQIRLKIETGANFQKAREIVREQIEVVTSSPACKGIQVICDVDPL